MKSWLQHVFIENWKRKLLAFGAAIVIWLLVSHSITITRTFPQVSIRVIGVPEDKTIAGMQPNGQLSHTIPLTLTGRKAELEALNLDDLEVVINAENKGDQWTTQIGKRNLRSLNPDVDLGLAVTTVSPVEFTVQLSPLISSRIPITVTPPIGDPPTGYQYLDLWPQQLYQTVSGPEQEVRDLQRKGLKLTFDLHEITQEELDAIAGSSLGVKEGEVRFFVPSSWKRVNIPFQKNQSTTINDPDAAFLHLDFLRQEQLPLNMPLPVQLFYPLAQSEQINPELYSLGLNAAIAQENGIYLLSTPLFTRNIGRLFLEVVRNYIALAIVVEPNEHGVLPWSVEFINPKELEERFVALSLEQMPTDAGQNLYPEMREENLRERFRMYMREFTLYTSEGEPLNLQCTLNADTIEVKVVHQATETEAA